jgi:hypothetical protein
VLFSPQLRLSPAVADFYTRHHARLLDLGSYWRAARRPALTREREYINVARTRSPTHAIERTHRWGVSLAAVAASLPATVSGAPPSLVDACLVFPRLRSVRATHLTDLQCPNVLYRQTNRTHYVFEASVDKVRPPNRTQHLRPPSFSQL